MNSIYNWVLTNPWLAASTLLALYLYFPLCIAILAKDPQKRIEQNIASWILWVSLDVIALVGVIIDKGNFVLIGAYTFGGTAAIASILFSSSKIKWTWIESLSTFLVIICLIVWYYLGSSMAIVASSIAIVIASIPQIVSASKANDKKSFWIYAGYSTANILSVIGGKNWSVEERYYPSLAAGACIITTLCYMRNTFPMPALFTRKAVH